MRNGVIRLPACPVADYRPRRQRLAMAVATASLCVLSSCTTFGTNIKGSFACGAPEGGSCAPATVIDDKALAEITGESSYKPAGPYIAPAQRAAPQRVAYTAGAPAEVSPQKVLRIVFPAHVDAVGRYHETSVVQAVVDNGQWLAATNGHGPGLAASSTLNVSPEILSQLGAPIPAEPREVSSAEPIAVPTLGPTAPSVEAVAAARAKARTPKAASPAPAAKSTPDALRVSTRSDAGAARFASTSPANRPASYNPTIED